MNFEDMLKHRTLHTIEEFDAVTGQDCGSFEIHKEKGDYKDISKNKWLNQEVLGNWAWDRLMTFYNYDHIYPGFDFGEIEYDIDEMIDNVKHNYNICVELEQAVGCLGKEEIEKRLKKLK